MTTLPPHTAPLPAVDPAVLDQVATLLGVVAKLRDPNGGCPWDLKQTHQTLQPHMLEEAYEAVEAMATSDTNPQWLREELGDVLLQVALHSQVAQDGGQFHFGDVCRVLAEKLIRRHPHVFGEATVADSDGVVQQWEDIKREEKRAKGEDTESVVSGVSHGLPALMRASKISKKAVKVGFRWPSDESLWACVMSEFDEFRAETQKTSLDEVRWKDRLEDEMGDILFATVSLANHYGVDPEVALTRATEKFIQRFKEMEARVEANRDLKTLSFEEWDDLWRAAKNGPQ